MLVLKQRGAAAGGGGGDAGLTRRHAAGWMDAPAWRCWQRASGGGADARGCGGGQGGQEPGELEVGVLGAQTEFLSFLRLVNRISKWAGVELLRSIPRLFISAWGIAWNERSWAIGSFVNRGLCCTGTA